MDEGSRLSAGGADADQSEPRPRKVLIISADIGEGHDLPARAVAREFRQQDPNALIAVVNGLPAMGLIATRMLRESSAWMFRWVPWLYDLQYRLFMDLGPTRWLAQRLLRLFGARGLIRLIASHQPDLIVSTYPGVTALLGELRRQGRLRVPCYSSITDLAGLRFWSHPGIDMHFVTHPESVEEVERIAGPGSVRWARPPTAPAFMAPRSRTQARLALDLADAGRVITISGGGWGVGDLSGAVRTALEVPGAEVLCLCGHNDAVRERISQQFAAEPRVRVMGFTDRMSDVLSASDALVHSTAGLTVLEALIRGCPVISYGFGYGHVRVSNEALERFGLARVARTQRDLGTALQAALAARPAPNDSFVRRASTAELIAASTRRVQPIPSWRVRGVRAATALTASFALCFGGLTASFSYGLLSPLFAEAHPITAVVTPRQQIGVLVDVSARDLPRLARLMSARGMHASFALYDGSEALVDRAVNNGDETVPRLKDGGVFNWIHTKAELDRLASELGWHGRFIYTSSGPSFGQWILAHQVGGEPVAGKVWASSATDDSPRLHPGEVVELKVSSIHDVLPRLQALAEQLQDSHLRAVPVSTLLKGSGRPV